MAVRSRRLVGHIESRQRDLSQEASNRGQVGLPEGFDAGIDGVCAGTVDQVRVIGALDDGPPDATVGATTLDVGSAQLVRFAGSLRHVPIVIRGGHDPWVRASWRRGESWASTQVRTPITLFPDRHQNEQRPAPACDRGTIPSEDPESNGPIELLGNGEG